MVSYKPVLFLVTLQELFSLPFRPGQAVIKSSSGCCSSRFSTAGACFAAPPSEDLCYAALRFSWPAGAARSLSSRHSFLVEAW